MPQSKHIHIRYDDVAVPEILIDDETEDALDNLEDSASEDELTFDDLAIPEIHIPKHHPKED